MRRVVYPPDLQLTQQEERRAPGVMKRANLSDFGFPANELSFAIAGAGRVDKILI